MSDVYSTNTLSWIFIVLSTVKNVLFGENNFNYATTLMIL